MTIFRIMLLCFTLTACGAGSTMVIDPYKGEKHNYTYARIENEGSNANVPDKIIADFNKAMYKQFYDKKRFAEGDGLKVKYTFIQYEAGSQFARWLTAGIGNAGEASLTVKIDFYTHDDQFLSTINVAGKIGSGFFGGSVSQALNKAAGEAAEYAVASFK